MTTARNKLGTPHHTLLARFPLAELPLSLLLDLVALIFPLLLLLLQRHSALCFCLELPSIKSAALWYAFAVLLFASVLPEFWSLVQRCCGCVCVVPGTQEQQRLGLLDIQYVG